MNKILACIDGGSHTDGVCDYAIWAAKRLQAPLEFLHVIEREPDRALVHDLSGSVGLGAQETLLAELTQLDEQHHKVAQEHGQKILEAAQGRATDAGVPEVGTRQRHGTLADTLLELQPETRLVVMGQHPQAGAVPRLHLDQNVERVVRSLRKPVWVATSGFQAPSHCAIAFDGSATGRKMVEALAASPLLRDMPCHVVMAGGGNSVAAEQLEWANQTLKNAGFQVRTTQRAGDAETVLHDVIAANQIDLLVMGAYGHSRIREFIVGSTTTTMLRTSPVPVLILR